MSPNRSKTMVCPFGLTSSETQVPSVVVNNCALAGRPPRRVAQARTSETFGKAETGLAPRQGESEKVLGRHSRSSRAGSSPRKCAEGCRRGLGPDPVGGNPDGQTSRLGLGRPVEELDVPDQLTRKAQPLVHRTSSGISSKHMKR